MKLETVQLGRELEDVIRGGNELAAQLDDAALMRRPSSKSWSVAENLEHLSATAATFARRIRRRLDAATVQSVVTDEKRSIPGRVWLRLVEPPVRVRLKVPSAALQPGEIGSREELLARFSETHATLLALLGESDGYDRMLLRIATPFARRVTVNMVDTFAVLAAHGRRHLWQAKRAAKV